ncbi:MAG: carbohydrate ABC transporter substrate-binding protein, partial [Oscillospiraceae bacterium]|nr:carbohydrate ABC transporter substrate-binding protein [Oscillospiraceae bacterium]
MKNKKVLSSVMAFVTLLGVTSCSQTGERSETTQSALTAASTTTTTAATLAEEDKQAIAEVETTYEKLENGTVKFLSSWDINPADGKPKQVSLEMFETNYGGKIEYLPCTWEERYEALGKMIAAGDSPDMFSAGDLDCFPQGAVSKMFLPLDDYVDFDSELWSPMKEVNDQFVFNGKHYVGATSTDAGVVMIYNQKTIEENGLADPAKLLEEGNWNWDTFYDMMIAFCDRTNEKYAVDGWWFEGAISLTTGVPYVGMKDGKIVQNLDDPMIEQVQRFMFNMKKQDLPFPKSEYGWQIHPENIGFGKTLFYPCGIWALYESDISNYGEMEDIRFVPMPACPYADAHYLPTSITGFTLCSGSKNPEGVAAYLDCLMICRDNEVAQKIEQEQIFEDYKWTPEMYDMLLKTREMTEQHPVIEFYTA